MLLFTPETESLGTRLTTETTEHRVDRSGWTTFAAVVQRQILTSVHTTAGVFTTVNTGKTLPYGATLVCSHNIIICPIAIAYTMGQIIQETHQEMRQRT